MIKKKSRNKGFSQFVNNFVYSIYSIFQGAPTLRMFQNEKKNITIKFKCQGWRLVLIQRSYNYQSLWMIGKTIFIASIFNNKDIFS